jgi:hypothetical protein
MSPDKGRRLILIGETDGGRVLTLIKFIPERDLGKGHKSVEETARRQALRDAQNAEAAAKP